MTLLFCLILDFIEYLFPPLMAPVVGDLLDFAGTVLSVAFFGWIGFISLLELIPGIDAIPVFTTTWLIWYILKKRTDMKRMEKELEQWR